MEDMIIPALSFVTTGLVGWGVSAWNAYAKTQKNLSMLQIQAQQEEWIKEKAKESVLWVYQWVKNHNKEQAKKVEAGEITPEDVVTIKPEEKLSMAVDFIKDASKESEIEIKLPVNEVLEKTIESVIPVVKTPLTIQPDIGKMFNEFFANKSQ
jgi:hypothetical protein